MKLYPAFLNLEGKRAVVVGGGPVAARKAGTLVEAGAAVTVISPDIGPALLSMALDGTIKYRQRRYRKGDFKGAAVAVAATDDPDTNRKAVEEARSLGILVNCASPPEAGNFIVPSSIQKRGLAVAITTEGGCPALSKKIRRDFEALLGKKYSRFLKFLEGVRAELKETAPDPKARGRIMDELVNSGMVELFEKREAAALKEARALFLDVCERTQR